MKTHTTIGNLVYKRRSNMDPKPTLQELWQILLNQYAEGCQLLDIN